MTRFDSPFPRESHPLFSLFPTARALCLEFAAAGGTSEIQQPPLPYPDNALEPWMSAKTISFHYGKHHKTYVDNCNNLIKGTPLAGKSLEEIIKAVSGKADQTAIFNNAAQAWNHSFFWKSMKSNGGGAPTGVLAQKIATAFGDLEGFKKQFSDAAMTQFGSGWAWLVVEGDTLKIVKTGNADTPIARGMRPLLTVDVWEHAYYLDYQNRRKDFVQAFLDHMANWDFAAQQL